jgi:hypothetical protein
MDPSDFNAHASTQTQDESGRERCAGGPLQLGGVLDRPGVVIQTSAEQPDQI